jgi:NAD(P)-dependent dehydrogenase (short-subunit alcohol dehydrogenase family)
MNSLFSLTNKVAIVTGAGRGLGKALALGLAQAGADVVVAARTATEIEVTAAEIRALGRRALSVPTDVRASDQVAAMVKRTLEEFNRIDVLVNNVGASFVLPALKLSEGGWDALLRENLKTCFLCSKAVAEVMIEQKKGSIINISSAEGLRAAPTNPAYGAAKAGVISLTQSLAKEWAPYHVRVNTIVPGFIATPALPLALQEYPHLRDMLERVPLGRAGKPEDFVGAVIYLASDASDYVTGAMIVIDGGLTNLLG